METKRTKDITTVNGNPVINGNAASDSDLELMRSQLSLLKRKLDKQAIVNDRLMRKAMSGQMSWITKYMWFAALVLLPLVCVSWWMIKQMLGLSWWSYGMLVVLTVGCVAADAIINRMHPTDWESQNLIQTASKLARMKHTRRTQVCIQCALLVIVMVGVGFDAYTANVIPHDRLLHLGLYMFVGMVIGGAIGLGILAKMQRTNDDIIRQIDELSKVKR